MQAHSRKILFPGQPSSQPAGLPQCAQCAPRLKLCDVGQRRSATGDVYHSSNDSSALSGQGVHSIHGHVYRSHFSVRKQKLGRTALLPCTAAVAAARVYWEAAVAPELAALGTAPVGAAREAAAVAREAPTGAMRVPAW